MKDEKTCPTVVIGTWPVEPIDRASDVWSHLVVKCGGWPRMDSLNGWQLLFWCKLKTAAAAGPGVGPNWMLQVAWARVGSSKDALKMSSKASPAAFPTCTSVGLGSASFTFVFADLYPVQT